MSALQFQFGRSGVYLPSLHLWLDPRRAQRGADRVFVSHAHSDHTGAHREVILTDPTARLMRARIGGQRLEHLLSYGEPRTFESGSTCWRMTLLPAGHILGSAMALIETGGGSLVYTGDFKLTPGLSSEPCDFAQAHGVDSLIMETTFGRPEYRFPPAAQVRGDIVRFCREAIDCEETPVLLGYSLGKSQELMRGLADAGLPIVLHEAAGKLTRIYEAFGQAFPAYEKFDGQPTRGKVVICPPMSRLLETLRATTRVRTAVVTGWAVDPGCRFRSRTNAAFPLSDHADFPELLEFVERVAPKRIYTVHGFAADFALELRERGYDARALGEQEQLTLPFQNPQATIVEVSQNLRGEARRDLPDRSQTSSDSGKVNSNSSFRVTEGLNWEAG